MDRKKRNVLFLCTGNSCRSQMAEGWARHFHGHALDAFSAGLVAQGLNPLAVRVMAEAGVDISGQKSKGMEDLPSVSFDAVITVCDHALESCPVFPGPVKRIHAGFDDPPRLAQKALSEKESLRIYRRVRDAIRDYVKDLPRILEEAPAPLKKP